MGLLRLVFEGRAIRLSDTTLIGLSILKKLDCAFEKKKDPDFLETLGCCCSA